MSIGPPSGLQQLMLQMQNNALSQSQFAGLTPQQLGLPAVPQPPLEVGELQVCDLIGWRVWRITATGYLQSASMDTIWLPGEPMTGEVSDYNGQGIHAYKTRQLALAHATHGQIAVGSVLLWGETVEHERGYRASRAKIISIDDVTWGADPPWSEAVARAKKFLRRRYGLSETRTRTVA